MRPKSFPELASWLPQVKGPINDHLSRYVRALAACHHGSIPDAWASGVTVVCGARPLLLTAKHVLDRLDGRHLLLEVPGRFEPIALRPELIAEDASADAVAILLPGDSFRWQLDFLNLDIQYEPSLTDDDHELFIAIGFPVREAAVDVERAQLGLTTVSYWSFEHRDAYRLLNISPTLMVATNFDRKRSFQYGSMRAMKKPEGMSGGTLWRLWGPRTEVPSLKRGCLAGIITEYHIHPASCMLSARLGVLQRLSAQLVTQPK